MAQHAGGVRRACKTESMRAVRERDSLFCPALLPCLLVSCGLRVALPVVRSLFALCPPCCAVLCCLCCVVLCCRLLGASGLCRPVSSRGERGADDSTHTTGREGEREGHEAKQSKATHDNTQQQAHEQHTQHEGKGDTGRAHTDSAVACL